MAEDRRDEPSLELPSLFRRRERRPPAPPPAPQPVPGPEPDPTVRHEPDPAPEPEPAPPRVRRADRTGPALPATAAAAVVGLVVGLVGAGLTYGGLEACDVLRGTASCGGGPGLLLLVAILVVMAVLGAVLLALLRVPDARSLSALGTGIVCVVALVGLLEVVLEAWMFVVVPLVAAVGYAVAAWVTTRVVEQVDDGPRVDVR